MHLILDYGGLYTTAKTKMLHSIRGAKISNAVDQFALLELENNTLNNQNTMNVTFEAKPHVRNSALHRAKGSVRILQIDRFPNAQR